MTESGRSPGSIAFAVERVLVAHQRTGELSFCNGQGSVLTGFTAESDLDLVMIWDAEVPPAPDRPATSIMDSGIEPVQYDGSFGGLDKGTVEGWRVDIAHYDRDQFDDWVAQVRAGDGWQEHRWPLPLFAISGYAYGRLLAPASEPSSLRALRTFPPALLEKSGARLTRDWPETGAELARCAARSDGWLFQQLASELLRTTYVTWFAAHQRYCPFPKHLCAWIRRLGLDATLATAERRIWRSASLAGQLEAITDLVDGVLANARGHIDAQPS